MKSKLIAAVLLLAVPAATTAGQNMSVAVERAIVLASAEAGERVAAYAVFRNNGAATSIVSASCECAESVELHFVDRQNPSRGMTNDWPLPLPEGSATAIAPPGVPRHIMLVGLRAPIAIGDQVRMRFVLADGATVEAAFAGVANSAQAWQSSEPAK